MQTYQYVQAVLLILPEINLNTLQGMGVEFDAVLLKTQMCWFSLPEILVVWTCDARSRRGEMHVFSHLLT